MPINPFWNFLGSTGTTGEGASTPSGGQGMDPLVGYGIISGINTLLQGILSGAGKKKRQKAAMDMWKEMAGERMAGLQKYVRPEGEYTDYSQDPVMMKAVLGMLNQRTGMNIDLSSIGQRVPKPQSKYVPKQTGYAYKE